MTRNTLDNLLGYFVGAVGYGAIIAFTGSIGTTFFAHPTSNNVKTTTLIYNYTGEPRLAQTGIFNATRRLDRDLMIGVLNGAGDVGTSEHPGGTSVQIGLININGWEDEHGTYAGCLVQIGAINFIGNDAYHRGTRAYPLMNFRCAPKDTTHSDLR